MKAHPFVPALVALGLSATPSYAITGIGIGTELPGTTVAERPELAGDIIATQDFVSHRQTISPDPAPDAILRDYVVRESGSGTLDFYFQLISNSTQAQRIFDMEITGFPIGASLDMDQIDPGTPYPHFSVTAYPAFETSPAMIIFGNHEIRGGGYFTLQPGEATAPMFIHTDATLFDTSGTIGFTGFVQPFGLYAPVFGGGPNGLPEPTSLFLLSLAAASLAYRFRRV